jgi:hypothetical protein
MRKTVIAKFLDSVPTRFSNDYRDVFVNPDSKELKEIVGKDGVCRAMIVNAKTIYCFPDNLLHYSVWDHFKLKDAVGIVLYFVRGKEISVQVTDITRRGKWLHNPKITAFIKSNEWLKRFKLIDIDYYDSAIEGDWTITYGEE